MHKPFIITELLRFCVQSRDFGSSSTAGRRYADGVETYFTLFPNKLNKV